MFPQTAAPLRAADVGPYDRSALTLFGDADVKGLSKRTHLVDSSLVLFLSGREANRKETIPQTGDKPSLPETNLAQTGKASVSGLKNTRMSYCIRSHYRIMHNCMFLWLLFPRILCSRRSY